MTFKPDWEKGTVEATPITLEMIASTFKAAAERPFYNTECPPAIIHGRNSWLKGRALGLCSFTDEMLENAYKTNYMIGVGVVCGFRCCMYLEARFEEECLTRG